MNPCPCGEGMAPGSCRCSEGARARYARRVSAPLLDRFDLAVRVDRPDVDELLADEPLEDTATVAARVVAARGQAAARGVAVNAELAGTDLTRVAPLRTDAAALLEGRLRRGAVTARGYRRVHRLARTIADLDDEPVVGADQVHEALAMRIDRSLLVGE
jgi:magnesium chelatase family protein